MTRHGVYDSDPDQFPLELEIEERDTDLPELEWDESEVSMLVNGIIGQHPVAD